MAHIKRLEKFVHFRLKSLYILGYLTNPAFHSEWPGPLVKLQEASLKARKSLANENATRYGPDLTVSNEMLIEAGIPENFSSPWCT